MKIQIITFLLFLLFSIGIFFLLNLLIEKKLSYDIEKRYLQFRQMIAALIVTAAVSNSLSSSFMLTLIDNIINNEKVTEILDFIMPARTFELIYMILCIVGLNLIYLLLMIVVMFITKLIFRNKTKYIDYDNCVGAECALHFPWKFVRRFYSNDDRGKISLSGAGFVMGMWAKGMKYAFAILLVIEFGFLYWSVLWGSDDWNSFMLTLSKGCYLIPMAGFIIAEQVQLFLESKEENETGSFTNVDIKAEMSGNIENLLYRYRDIYSETGVLLYSETGGKDNIEKNGLRSNDIGNTKSEDCMEKGILAVISNQIRESGVHQNTNYQNVVISLLNGKNVSIRDNCRGEFTIYLCAYLNYFLSQGKMILFLCKNRDEAVIMNKALTDNTSRLNVLDSVWNIRFIDNINENGRVNVLLCTYDEFLSLAVNEQYKYMLDSVYNVVVPDADALMTLDYIRTEMIFSKLRIFTEMKQFIFLSETDSDSMRAKLRMYLPENSELCAYSNDMRKKNTSIMVWKEESAYRMQRTIGIGNAMSPYLGCAIPIALTALKYDLPQVYIVPEEDHGDLYYYNNAMQSNQINILNYLGKEIDIKSNIRMTPEDALGDVEIKMLVVYDTEYNFINALWRWFKYSGSRGTIIHVISPHYMLREYFAANFKRKKLLYSNNEFTAMFPSGTVLMKSRLAAILATLGNIGLTENEIMNISRKYNWDYTDVTDLLMDAVLTVRSNREFHNIYEHFSFKEEKYFDKNKKDFVSEVRIYLSDENMIGQQKAQLSMARMSYKNSEYIELDVLCGNILNYYLPDQVISFGGNFYNIKSVDAKEGVVYTLPAHTVSVADYYIISDFVLSDYTVIDNCMDSPVIDFNICRADAERLVYGYLSSSRGNDFSRSNKPTVNCISNSGVDFQSVRMKDVSILEINIRNDSLGGSPEIAKKAIRLLCVLLNGLFRTLFPETHQNLIAAPDFPIDRDTVSRVMKNSTDCTTEDLICISVPRVSSDGEKTDNGYSRIYIIEFSCLEFGMVEQLYLERNKILNQIYEYLNWYLASCSSAAGSGDGFISGKYLHFGLDSIPDVFAPEELLQMLSEVTGMDEEEVFEPDPVDSYVRPVEQKMVCSFCGREVVFSWMLSDGRCMCANCHDHQKTQRDEINKLYMDAKRMLEEHYHISFPSGINLKFQSADAIRKASGGYKNGRIVGFYKHEKRQILIEARGPAVAMESTIIHELTHAWQYDTLPVKQLIKSFPKKLAIKRFNLLLEGHAVFIEIEAMHDKGEIEYARWLRESFLSRNDEYGVGYKLVSEYMSSKKEEGSHITSFVAMEELTQAIINKEAVFEWPEGY